MIKCCVLLLCVCRVDFFIPDVEKVGGFSMCSSPGLLQREGVVELAVKYAKHPPAHWVHTTVSTIITSFMVSRALVLYENQEN